jgi:hypothetical protein
VQGYLALARISSSLLLEVLIDGAALHEIAPRSAHRANDDFLVLEESCESRIRLFYKNLELKRLEVSAVGREACYATTQGAVQIRRGGDDANVILGQSEL